MAALLLGITLLSIVLPSWQKVESGHGMETFYNPWGIELNHIMVLVLVFVILPLALLIGFGVQRWESWKERDLRKDSGVKK